MNSELLRDLSKYLIGFALAAVLSAIPFALVATHTVTGATARIVIGFFVAAQLLVHFYFFLHINLNKQKREDLYLILFTSLIVLIMVAGTFWVIADLHMRML